MCAAWKKKNERNEIVCFYCTQSDILLCGIARFSRGNKNKLRTFQPQKWKKFKNSQPQTKFTGSYKKKSVFIGNIFFQLSLKLLNFWMSFKRCLEHIAIIILRHFKFMFVSMSGPGCHINVNCFGGRACLEYLLSCLVRGVGRGWMVAGWRVFGLWVAAAIGVRPYFSACFNS